MAFQSVPDAALFTAEFAGPDGTTPSFSVVSYNNAAPWDASQIGAVCDAIEAVIISDYVPLLSNDSTFVRMVGRDLEAQNGLVLERTAVNEVGALASPSLPANTAVRVKFVGAPGGFPARGGCYLLAPAESQVVGSVVQATPLGLLQDFAEALSAAAGPSAASHAMVSRYQGTTETEGPGGRVFRTPIKRAVAVTNLVNSVVVQSRIASQRKRRPAAA